MKDMLNVRGGVAAPTVVDDVWRSVQEARPRAETVYNEY
jgi:hypothetical protein